MKLIRTLADWQQARGLIQDSVGFVPTMGGLHAGHAALLERCVAENTVSVLSIYVNPTQFNNADDLAHYPDTLSDDLAMAERLGVDLVLLPAYAELYADDYRFKLLETSLSGELCGEHRPGHFDGVLTVVMKLLNIVRPDRAYFGEKDYQQFELIRDMCAAFFLPVHIVPCPTVREHDGLAMSTRNLRLTPQDRALAASFPELLRNSATDQAARLALSAAGFEVDYVVTRAGRRFAAASVGQGEHEVRLIDNIALGERSDAQIKAASSPSKPLAEAS
ncbi:MAG: pantoate--beta-alanine ligase [Pseudomonadales bacterium]